MMDLSSIYIANDATFVWTNGITVGKVESIGNPADIRQGTGFGLRERDRDGIGLGHYRLRATWYQGVVPAGYLSSIPGYLSLFLAA